MTWTPATSKPKRDGYYAIRFTWSALPDIAHFCRRRGWRKSGRALHGVEAYLELPAYASPKDPYL